LIKYESEVFSDCGAWKNFYDLEDSLSLDELLALFGAAIKRQNRLIRTIAAAMGAEMEDEEEDYPQPTGSERPAWQIDPNKGGQAEALYGAEQVMSLPIGLGYSTE